MDIRSYFQSNRKKTDSPKDAQPTASSKTRKRAFIESDSEDESPKVSRETRKKKTTEKINPKRKSKGLSDSSDSEHEEKKKNTPKTSKLNGNEEVNSKKRSRKLQIIDSSSEENSPVAKKKPAQKKLDICVKSKFFKEVSAANVFGDQPIKRDNSKLLEIQEKLKKTKTSSNNDVKLDDDDEFEATLLQLDDVGMNWINSSDTNTSPQMNEQAKISPKKSESSTPKSETFVKETKKDESSVKNRAIKNDEPKKSAKTDKPVENKNSKELKKPKEEMTETKNPKTSVKDKLNQFRASPKSDKRVSFEVMQTEKLLSTRSTSSPSSSSLSSGYSSLSPNCDSSNTDSSSETKFTSAKSVLSSNSLSSSGYSSLSPSCNSVVNSLYDSPNSDVTVTPPKSSKEAVTKVETKIVNDSKKLAAKDHNKIEDSNVTKDMKNSPQSDVISNDCSPWVEKYKPDSTKKIIGQQGDKSNVKKLTNWLNDWYKNNAGNKKPKFVPSGWNKDQTGACFKAALLSGPPGVGKTTTVTLVCKELGFDAVEFNASDTRSKKLLQEEVAKMLTNTSITSLFGASGSFSVTRKHVLVMDEVDGMAGNEDRGGIQELIQLIKITKVPIICMCNDRNHPKIRSLVNYCFDLKFQRPRVEQIKGYMKTVCFKEKLNISNDVLTNVITSSNNDVRLVLNHLSMLAADKNSDLEASKKYVKLNPWDVLRKVFSKEDHKSMSIHDKCDLFFYDYSIAPLFVQENYLTVKPLNAPSEDKVKKMRLFAQAADCISIGDRVDNEIRSHSAWSLLPTQAIFSSYAPGEILEGYCTSQINFPAWLGKNSRRGKIDRLLQEIQIHTRLRISGSKESINLEYAPYLRNRIVEPLLKDGSDGAKSALEMLHEYDLLKEDLDSLNEICSWPNSVDPMSKIDSKVKAAFTRLYNKNPPVRPYSLTAAIKKRVASDMLEEETSDIEDDEEENDTDAMIIVKKKPSNESPAPSTSKAKPKSNEITKKGIKKR